jgi:hypothetical protein
VPTALYLPGLARRVLLSSDAQRAPRSTHADPAAGEPPDERALASLNDFTPLEALILPGLGKVDCTGLILVVGPNSSGKSQLLRDIHQRVSGEPRQLVVASEVATRRLPYEPLMKCLADEGFIYTYQDDGGASQVRPLTTYVGTGQYANAVQANQIHSWHQAHSAGSATLRSRDEYLGYLGRFLVTALFLEQRLIALNQTGLIDFVSQPPQHDLHALYLNDTARAALLQEVRHSFSKAVWPDISRGTGVCLELATGQTFPTQMIDCHQQRWPPTGRLKPKGTVSSPTWPPALRSY